ncbi:MAG: 3-deoxy-8-phosphooctulonate synthase [Elusimicrobia bacterium]|nr:3-deoxy-8-phosphooctulonate synthase [Elusimicrobiota bacterium]
MANNSVSAKKIKLNSLEISNHLPLALIAGPCIMESKKHLWDVARFLKFLASQLNIPLIFKCSYDKANRSSQTSYRGLGLEKGLHLLAEIKEHFSLPILTDVHLPEQAQRAAQVADILQIPAFLCRQTDLIQACAQTGKIVNVKKGQFISPWEMENIIEKIESFGNHKILLTERGTSFGYNNLVVDMRGLEIMKRFGYPVVFDATHSVQLPGGNKKSSGGQREFVEPLARAATAIGVAAIFMEVHPNPDQALSDGPNSVQLSQLKKYLKAIIAIDQLIKK